MAVVRHIIRHPDTGQLLAGKTVPFLLASPGFVPAEHSEIIQTSYERTDANGQLSVDLTPNTLINPSGTYYLATMPGASSPWTFVVPAGTPPNTGTDGVHFWWLQDILVTGPPTPAPIAVGIQGIVQGTGIVVDATDPAHPIVSAPDVGDIVSVNGHTGTVVLAASDVGAVPANGTVASIVRDASGRFVSDVEGGVATSVTRSSSGRIATVTTGSTTRTVTRNSSGQIVGVA